MGASYALHGPFTFRAKKSYGPFTLYGGCVCSKHAFSGISWAVLTLEVGKSPTEVTCGRHVCAQVTSVGDLRVHFVVEL